MSTPSASATSHNQQRLIAAMHEAGHAVTAILLKQKQVSVRLLNEDEVIYDEQRYCTGMTSWLPYRQGKRQAPSAMSQEQAWIIAAGPMAQSTYMGFYGVPRDEHTLLTTFHAASDLRELEENGLCPSTIMQETGEMFVLPYWTEIMQMGRALLHEGVLDHRQILQVTSLNKRRGLRARMPVPTEYLLVMEGKKR